MSENVLVQKVNKESPMIDYVPSHLGFHSFSAEIGDIRYLYEVLKMKDSVLIFINAKDHKELSDLSLAMQNRYSNLPVCTRIIGDFTDETSKGIAGRAAKKLNKTVYLSLNVAADKHTLPLIQKQLFMEIKSKRDKF